MILKLFLCGRHNVSSSDPERTDQSEESEDDLNAADDGEAAEESYGSSNETQLGLSLDLFVFFNVVKGCCVKIDLN